MILELGLVLSAGVGYIIARHGLRPIARMATTVKQIGSESLNERVRPTRFFEFADRIARLDDGRIVDVSERAGSVSTAGGL